MILYDVAGITATSRAIHVLDQSLTDERNAAALTRAFTALGTAAHGATQRSQLQEWLEDLPLLLRRLRPSRRRGEIVATLLGARSLDRM
jgi:hypothetical protein